MDKSVLRKIYLEKRLALTDEEYEKRNQQLIEKLFTTVDFNIVKYLHIFLPISKFREVNTWPIIDSIQAQYPSIKIAIPKVKGNDLAHYLYESKKQLKISKWGIEEPSYGTQVTPELFDVVLVPLLIADKHGNRIGYGKGYYDRFLPQCKLSCKVIGLSLFPTIDTLECISATDIALDKIIV